MIRLEKIEVYGVELPRKGVFRIATGSSSSVKNIVLRIRSKDAEGWGAGAPTRVTGETLEGIEGALKTMKKFEGIEFDGPLEAIEEAEKAIGKHPSALAAFDIAVFDLFARYMEMPLYRYLSEKYHTKPRERVMTDITLGIDTPEKTVKKAVEYANEGFRALKVKIGLDFKEDMKRIKAVRDAVGDGVRLWADANQGYTPDESVKASEILSERGYEFFEQPVRWDALESLKEISVKSKIPVFADESAKSIETVRNIAENRIADGINIKLMKFGGIRRSVKVRDLAIRRGLSLMVGCMGETSLTVAAALHLAMAFPEIRYADLDSHFMLEKDLANGIYFEGGWLRTEGNGLGVAVRKDGLRPL